MVLWPQQFEDFHLTNKLELYFGAQMNNLAHKGLHLPIPVCEIHVCSVCLWIK